MFERDHVFEQVPGKPGFCDKCALPEVDHPFTLEAYRRNDETKVVLRRALKWLEQNTEEELRKLVVS